MLFVAIAQLCRELSQEFDRINDDRKALLDQERAFVQEKHDRSETAQLVYVCTHNSRRSHIGQIAGAVAAAFYDIEDIETFSAGTEATAIHENTLKALETIGFQLSTLESGANPVIRVGFGTTEHSICFSKTIDDKSLPQSDFAALMTCDHADENCPFIPGCALRLPLRYEDPKKADGTSEMLQVYTDKVREILREQLYVFSKITL
ncbi:MAG: hypothetical protein ACOVO3_00990 [Fluviicola sp.]